MKRPKKITIVIIVGVFLGLSFSCLGFAGTTATFTARCYMPEIIVSQAPEQIATQNKEAMLEDTKEKDKVVSETNPNIVQKTEEIISEETKEPQIITTVCAK